MFEVTQPEGIGNILLKASAYFKLKGQEVYFNGAWVTEDFTAEDASVLFDEATEVPTIDGSIRRQQEVVAKVAEALGAGLSVTEQKPTDKTPEWAPDTFVKSGEARAYGGAFYACIQAHVTQAGWEPPTVPSLWRSVAVAKEPDSYPAWVQPLGAHDAYAVGAIVTHKGKTWKNTYAANSHEPGVYGWVEYATPIEIGAKK